MFFDCKLFVVFIILCQSINSNNNTCVVIINAWMRLHITNKFAVVRQVNEECVGKKRKRTKKEKIKVLGKNKTFVFVQMGGRCGRAKTKNKKSVVCPAIASQLIKRDSIIYLSVLWFCLLFCYFYLFLLVRKEASLQEERERERRAPTPSSKRRQIVRVLFLFLFFFFFLSLAPHKGLQAKGRPPLLFPFLWDILSWCGAMWGKRAPLKHSPPPHLSWLARRRTPSIRIPLARPHPRVPPPLLLSNRQSALHRSPSAAWKRSFTR